MGKRKTRLSVGVIEPDDDLRQVFFELFDDAGFDVCVARDLRDLGACAPDVILTDPPDLRYDRERTAAHIDGLRAGAPVQIVLLSDNDHAVEDVGVLGAAAVVTKPFEIDELLTLLPSLAVERGRAGRARRCVGS